MSNTLILDFGNAFLKAVSSDRRTPVIIPSCIHKLTAAQLREQREINDHSPFIEDGSSSYYVGSIAQSYGGINNWSGNKIDNVLLGLQSVVSESRKVKQLIVCVPDSSIEYKLADLLGLHQYRHNQKSIQLSIDDVEIMDETYGLWLGSRTLVADADSTNIYLTIGAGTVNLVFYSGSGTVLHRAVSKKGMASIASNVASAIKSTHNLPSTPKIANIMQGMATQQYRLIGSGIDYSTELQSAIENWKSELRSFVADTTTGLDLDYQQFVIGGAGAAYLPPSPSTIIVPRPQTFAIESLLSLYL